ncbi:MAG: TraB/GumN family protein [Treponema sp.]|nr:TraB/GumN family protein [Treponema sp.]
MESTSTKKILDLAGRKITLIGTAHVSAQSVEEVKAEISSNPPQCAAIELDSARYESMTNPEKYKDLDIIKVLKRGEALLILANLILSSFQKRMGQNIGVQPGDEMRAAIDAAQEKNIPFELVDRPIKVTLNRAWAKNSFWGKCKLLAALISSAFTKEEISEEEIESLKKENEMDSMMGELSEFLPTVKEVLIDERDRYLAAHIWECKNDSGEAAQSVTAILGAGHLPGVQKHLEAIAAGTETTDTEEISKVPPKGIGSKILGWTIPALIVALIALGFYFGGKKMGGQFVGSWVIWNGALAAIGTLIAAGHPLTILIAFLGAPITSLCPLVGVGLLTGIVQALVKKPKVKDMETLADDAESLKGFYSNRITRVLLVFILSSLGSSIGTFAAGATIVKELGAKIMSLFG